MELTRRNVQTSIPLLALYCALCLAAGFISSSLLRLFLVIGVFYSSFLTKRIMPALLFLATSTVVDLSFSTLLYIVAILPAYINRYTIQTSVRHADLAFLPLCLLLPVSFGLGQQSNANTMLLFFLALCVFVTVRKLGIGFEEVKKYAYAAFALLSILLIRQIATGGVQLYYGRLVLSDNVREVANVIAIPAVISLIALFKEGRHKPMDATVAFVSSLTLLATLSRGAILAVAIALFLYLILSRKISGKRILLLILVAGMLVGGYKLLESTELFSLSRLFADADGLSGRTDIWGTYWRAQCSSPITLLFGFGPGNVNRLGISTYYAHSLFLDVLFSYGVLGFAAFLLPMLGFFYKMLRAPAKEGFCIAVFVCLLYATHGVCTALNFYILFATGYALAVHDPEANRNEPSVLPEEAAV